MESLASASSICQIIGCSIISTSLNTSTPRMALPSHPNNFGMRKRFQDSLKCTGLHKLQHCLAKGGGGGGGVGRGEKERHIVLIVLIFLSPIVAGTC